jgi:hypothetical protein
MELCSWLLWILHRMIDEKHRSWTRAMYYYKAKELISFDASSHLTISHILLLLLTLCSITFIMPI